ncbi:hypothetical protein ABZ419_02455 [Streptomyces cinnamoneus]|uniref:hypothetical protein n=1 Tax=Streptomyces cinnamoneus TaxID=53446 RepID=UPI00340F2AAC
MTSSMEDRDRPDWAAMDPADFDAAIPNELHVPAAARIFAVSDRFGTSALFGDEPPPARTAPRKPASTDSSDAQPSLF